MRKLAVALLIVAVAGAAIGCGGPYYLSNSVSDFYNQKYGESPWLFGNVVSNWLYGIAIGVTFWLDQFVNAYYFWAKDAQPLGDGKGTVFEHKNPTSGKKMPK